MSDLPPGWLEGDTPYFIRHISALWMMSKSLVKERTLYSLWLRSDGKWKLIPESYDSPQEADEAREINQQRR